ncbi:hypothetical protein GW17_00061112, partial [Ensete ventricosum]
LPRLGVPSTHVWVKSEGAGRASRAQSITPLPFLANVHIIPQIPEYKRICEQWNWYTSEAHAKHRNMHAPIQIIRHNIN